MVAPWVKFGRLGRLMENRGRLGDRRVMVAQATIWHPYMVASWVKGRPKFWLPVGLDSGDVATLKSRLMGLWATPILVAGWTE